MNLKSLSTTELAKLRRNVLAELKARRPKSAKPKVRKVKSAEERERARLYAEFREVHTECWNCGARSQPYWWTGGVWLPNERAHITKDGLGKRLETQPQHARKAKRMKASRKTKKRARTLPNARQLRTGDAASRREDQ